MRSACSAGLCFCSLNVGSVHNITHQSREATSKGRLNARSPQPPKPHALETKEAQL